MSKDVNSCLHLHASADASMSSVDPISDDSYESLPSLCTGPHRTDNLDDILDRHEAIFDTSQSPAEAPSPTLHPTEPSETSWECIESIPPTCHPFDFESRDMPELRPKTQHKEVALRMQSRAKYIASLPKLGA